MHRSRYLHMSKDIFISPLQSIAYIKSMMTVQVFMVGVDEQQLTRSGETLSRAAAPFREAAALLSLVI